MIGIRSFITIVALALSLALATSIAATTATAAELSFDLRIERGRVAENMRVIRVKQGDKVKLRFTADQPVILHLHGYDIEKEIKPDAVGEIAFDAYATGRFSIQTHVPKRGSTGHAHVPPLVRIEVHPR